MAKSGNYIRKRLSKYWTSFKTTSNPVQIVAFLALASAFTMYILLALQTRFLADDFCMGRTLDRYGYIHAQSWWYAHWSGRFSYFLLIHALVGFGPMMAPIWLVITLLSFLASLLFLIREICFKISSKKPGKQTALILSLTVAIAYITSLQSVTTSLLWVSGALTYIWPIITFNFLIVGLLRRWHPVVLFLLALICSGFSEAFSIGLIVVMASLTLITLFERGHIKTTTTANIAGLLGSILGTILLVAAPGNAIRQQAVINAGGIVHPSITHIIHHGLIDTLLYTSTYLSQNTPAIVLMLLLGFALGLIAKNRGIVRLYHPVTIVFVMLVCVLCISFVSEYAIGGLPAERAFAIPDYFILIAAVGVGLLAQMCSRREILSSNSHYQIGLILGVLISIYGTMVIASTLKSTSTELASKSYSSYTRKWDSEYTFHNGLLLYSGNDQRLGFTGGLIDITPKNMNQVCNSFYSL